MAEVDVQRTVFRLAAAQVDERDVAMTADTDLFDDLGFDSLDVIELCMALEEELRITLDETALDDVKTLGALTAHVVDLVKTKAITGRSR